MGETLATILEVIEGEAGQRNTKVEVLRLDKVKLRWYRDVTKRYIHLRADERERRDKKALHDAKRMVCVLGKRPIM